MGLLKSDILTNTNPLKEAFFKKALANNHLWLSTKERLTYENGCALLVRC